LPRPVTQSLLKANRREALTALGAFLAASPLLQSQQDPFRDHTRVPGLNELLTAFDFEPVAYARITRTAYDYTAYGVDGEFTLRRNRQAFDWVQLIPKRVAVVDTPQTATELFGTKMAYPIMVSPSAAHSELHAEAEPGTHKGANAASATPYIVSNNSSTTYEKIAAAAPSPMWVQLYPKQQLEANQTYLESAQAAGAKAIVVTVDQQTSSYERSQHDRNLGGRGGAGRGAGAGFLRGGNAYRVPDNRLWYEWKFFEDIRPFCKVPVLVKGIVTAEDAKLAVEHGVQGIYISNHGGRSLDYEPSTLEVLPEIVDAVGSRVPVIIDGGIRRGTDVLKALALGASAVCLGRVPRWGLAAYGSLGVQRILEIMQAEFLQAMQAAGCDSLKAIDKKIALTNFP
jgi:4-hydroxymandelate oxidase